MVRQKAQRRRGGFLRAVLLISLVFQALASLRADSGQATTDLSTLERIDVEPKQLHFRSPRETAIILVTGVFSNGHVMDLTREARFTSTDPAVAQFRDGAVWPAGNGSCLLHIEMAGRKTSVSVSVERFEQPAPVSFRTETVAALTRQGCNSGACHGSPSGKGGFQLSLQAYDHAMDERSLTLAEAGRRTNPIEPTQSLLLLKPTMSVPHEGGLRLRTTDYAYDLLRQWIAEGCRVDDAEGKKCLHLELLPASGRVLKRPYLRQQIVARAHYENGEVRDVTRLTKFTSSDEHVASVTDGGLLIGHKRGQVAIMARYLDQLVSCQFTLVEDIEGFQWPNPPANNYIDDLVYDKLKQLQFEPSSLSTDHEFLRRVYLDVLGLLPTIKEQEEFLTDTSPNRRDQLIDRLLHRPEFARFWALKWADLLRLQKSKLKETGVHKFYNWLVEVFESNMPYNQFASQLLTAQGSTYDHPAANYYRVFDDPTQAAETTAQLFLGSRIQCAKCHNHPFENWTQDNFYGLTAFFNRVNRKPGRRIDEEIVYLAREGEVRQPRTGQTMKPWLPGSGTMNDAQLGDRRRAFVEWLTHPQNPHFARVAVNRIWAEVMGQGIVDPVDDFRQSNPPAIPTLLDRLAEDFAQHGYDLKHALGTILRSRVYQLSSRPTAQNRDDTRFFSHAKLRMLTAEQLLDAICQVTDLPEPFTGLPPHIRATELPSPDFKNEFLDTFGRPARATACVCERGTQSTLAQVVELMNGALIRKKLADKQNRFHRLLAEGRPSQEVIELLYRTAVCRLPTEAEMNAAMTHLAASASEPEGLEDFCWALLNTDEFLMQH